MGILRLFLAMGVIASHAGSFFGIKLTGGLVSVQTFFMISGFYMALILNEKYIGPGSYKTFIKNRLLRIYPVYIICIAITLLCATILYLIFKSHGPISLYFKYDGFLAPSSIVYLIISNLAIIGQDWSLFMAFNQNGELELDSNFMSSDPRVQQFLLIPQAWSLGLELSFYVIAPLIVRKKAYVIALVILSLFILRAYFYTQLNLYNDPWNYRFFPFEVSMFLLGALCYKAYKRLINCRLRRMPELATIVAATATLFYSVIPHNLTYLHFNLIHLAFYFLIFILMPLIFIATKHNKTDKFLGELSFPAYLIHVAVMKSLEVVGVDNSLAVLCITILISIGMIAFIIYPLDNIRARNSRKFNQRRSNEYVKEEEKTNSEITV